MDSKIVNKSFLWKPTGTQLLIFLTIVLLVASIVVDRNNNNPNGQLISITLPFLSCTLITGLLGFWAVPWLRFLKTGQYVQEDGPQTHLKKAGTPTMGGIFFLPTAVIIALVWTQFNPDVIAVSLVTLAYVFIGWIDDWQVIRLKSNKGISPKTKLILQILISVIFCFWVYSTKPSDISNVFMPANLILPLGWLFFPLAGFAIVAESNATNLTDGVDGLAGGTVAIALMGLAILVTPTNPELMIFCASLSGGCLGFLIHNRNPARVFMGDTGSLALGPALTAVAILTHNLYGLLIISGLFVVECLSVVAQVSYYKATKGPDGQGKRLFKMAPIHHHLELSGWSETQIVGVFYVINTLLVGLSFL